MAAVNTRISQLLESKGSAEPAASARAWFSRSGTNQVSQVNQWAEGELMDNAVVPVKTEPVRNWDAWQSLLAATIRSLINAKPSHSWPQGQLAAYHFFTGKTECPPGGPGNAPREVVRWVISVLPAIVFTHGRKVERVEARAT
jgi:hypothetical protein